MSNPNTDAEPVLTGDDAADFVEGTHLGVVEFDAWTGNPGVLAATHIQEDGSRPRADLLIHAAFRD